MSPSDEPQKIVNDVRSLVGGTLRAGICRMRMKEESKSTSSGSAVSGLSCVSRFTA